MSDHLVYDTCSGEVKAKSKHGLLAVQLLQLNDPDIMKYRVSASKILGMCLREITHLQTQVASLKKKLNKGELTSAQYKTQESVIEQDIKELNELCDRTTGKTPLPPLRTTRLGITVLNK